MAVCALVVPVWLAGSVAMAEFGGDRVDPEDIFENTPVEHVMDTALQQAQLTGAPVGEAGGGVTGGAAIASTASTFSFFPDQEMPYSLQIEGPIGCGQGVEPEVKSGPDGSIYVTAQEGTPGGIMLWRRNPNSFTYTQMPKPDGLPGVTKVTGLTGSGGDNELAIGTRDPALGGRYRIYASALSLAAAGVSVSTDGGHTWFNNPVATSMVGIDRQWLAAAGTKHVWLAYHETWATTIMLTRSDDGGITWGAPREMFTLDSIDRAGRPNGNHESNLVALPTGGVATLFTAFGPTSSKRDEVWIAYTDAAGALHNVKVGNVEPTAEGLFPALATDTAGNLYATASNLHGVFLSISRNHGATWSPFTNISAADPTGRSASTVFPYVIAGTPGRIALAWLGSDNPGGDTDATSKWTVQFAYSANALDAIPTFAITTASDHIVHTGVVCLNGTTCNPLDNSRALAEVVQMGRTRDGRALIAYPDDHAGDHAGAFAYVVEQNAGPGLLANITPNPPAPPASTGGPVPTFTPGGSLPLYFTSSGSGLGAGDGLITKPGYTFDGTSIVGQLSGAPGSQGHAGIIGYAANDTPELGKPVVFTGAPLGSGVTIGGNLDVTLWVQNELGSQSCSLPAECGNLTGATELDFSLLDVAPDGSTRNIVDHAVGDATNTSFTGGSDPKKVTLTVPISGGWQLIAGHHLRIEMTFPFVVSSATRLYYGDSVYASGLSVSTGI